MLQQGAPGLGWGDAAPAPHQQLGAEGEFHLPDAGGSGREGQIGAGRPMRDAAGLHNVAEQGEVREIEAHGRQPSCLAKASYAKQKLQQLFYKD